MITAVLVLGVLAFVGVLIFLGSAVQACRKQARKLARSKAKTQKEITPWSI